MAVAEVSLGLAGFAGVIAALHLRERWHPLDAWRTISLLGAGFSALILSLLPLALHSFGVSESTIWRVCSGAMATFNVAGAGVGRHYQPDPETIPHYTALASFFMSLVVVNTLVQVSNTFAFLIPGVFGAFFVGLLLHLIYGAVQFVVIIFLRPPT